MKALLLLFFILIGCTDLSARDSTLVTVQAGNKVIDVLTTAELYHYPQFTNGKVFFGDVQRHLKDNKVNFDKKDNLEKLTQFLSRLY